MEKKMDYLNIIQMENYFGNDIQRYGKKDGLYKSYYKGKVSFTNKYKNGKRID